jgi:pyruvate/2-oxoglutarate dehydrogenase complex dihydrolipoamide acyltransferase (E2) component
MGDRFPAETPDGVEMVKKDVTTDGSAVILTDEEGQMYQPNSVGAMVEATNAPVAINAPSMPGDDVPQVDATLPDDNSDEVKAMEQSIEEATGSKATLTASEAQTLVQSAEAEGDAQAPEEAAAEEAAAPEAAEEVEATPAAEALAAEEGVDLSEVEGSGEDGKILKSDVEAAADEA